MPIYFANNAVLDFGGFTSLKKREREASVSHSQMLIQETSIRYLGVHIDYNISWKTHIINISKKIKRSIGILSKLRYFLSTKTLLSLYYALVEPFLLRLSITCRL